MAAAILAIAAGVYLLFRGGVPVDPADTVPGSANDGSDHRPVMRAAVGAMLSPETTRDYYKELLMLIGDKLGYRMVFTQRRTYSELNSLLETRQLDFALVCSGPYVEGKKKFKMELLAVPVSHGKKTYHSYIIVPKGSPAKAIEDLKDKVFAFTDPHSNTGFLVPSYMLSKKGLKPLTFFARTFFTGAHDNAIKAVAEGLADGAAVDSLIWEFMNETDPSYTARTRIITKSPPYGIPPIVVHPGLDPGLKAALREAFLSLHEDPIARKLMRQIQFDRFEKADDGMYDSVREMQRWLEKEGK